MYWPKELSDPDGLPQDTRNVIDHFRYWEDEAIRAALDEHRQPFSVAVENLAHDFNIGTVVRNANAFLASCVYVCGRRKWDKRGAVGTYKYGHVEHRPDIRDLLQEKKAAGIPIVAIEQTEEAVSLYDFSWPRECLMLLGQESIGTSPWALSMADHHVYIPQFGSTRSLNVGVASGLAMFAWQTQHPLPETPWDEAIPGSSS